jgi:hypothetical protein
VTGILLKLGKGVINPIRTISSKTKVQYLGVIKDEQSRPLSEGETRGRQVVTWEKTVRHIHSRATSLNLHLSW